MRRWTDETSTALRVGGAGDLPLTEEGARGAEYRCGGGSRPGVGKQRGADRSGQLTIGVLEELMIYRSVKRARAGPSATAVAAAGLAAGSNGGSIGAVLAMASHTPMPPHCKELLAGKCSKTAGKCDKPHLRKKQLPD